MRLICSYEHAASRRDDGWDVGIPCSGFAAELSRSQVRGEEDMDRIESSKAPW